MSTTYTGIDYGLGRSNIDNQTGIRFGVISQHSISPDAFDDVWMNARDLSYENAVAEFKADIGRCESADELSKLIDDRLFNSDAFDVEGLTFPLSELALADVWNELEQPFNDGHWDEGDRDWLYESGGYRLTNCLHTDVMVLASPYFTYAQYCSPCVPGACNLDSPLACDYCDNTGRLNSGTNNTVDNGPERECEHCQGTGYTPHAPNKCYCLGHDYFEGGKAPYPVYSVATGELVNP